MLIGRECFVALMGKVGVEYSMKLVENVGVCASTDVGLEGRGQYG